MMPKTPLVGLVVFASLVRAGPLLYRWESLGGDPDGYRQLADNLLQHGTYGHGDTPTAYRPPLYPLLLTVVAALGQSDATGIAVLHLVLGVITVCLAYHLAARWGLGRFAWLAAALVACDPILMAQSTQVMSETPAALLAVWSLVLLTAAARRPSVFRVAAAGVSTGLAVLCRPAFLVWTAALAVLLPWMADKHLARVKVFAVFAAAVAVVLAPWAGRNQIQFGRPITTTTHGGYTMLRANNPSFYRYLRDGAWGSIWDSSGLDAAWAATLSQANPRDELARDRLAYAQAWENIRRQPGMFFYSCAVRVGRLWALVPHQTAADEGLGRRSLRYAVGLWYLAEFVLAAVGALAVGTTWSSRAGTGLENPDRSGSRTMGQQRVPGRRGWIWGLLLAGCFTAVHAVYWTNMRMRAPLVPVVALATAAGSRWILSRTTGRKPMDDNSLCT